MARRFGKRKAGGAASDGGVLESAGPSPNLLTNLIMADIALRAGGAIMRRGIERGLLGAKYTPQKAKDIVKGRTLTQTLVGTALARVATRSVPGAIVVGGAMLAKALHDRSKGRHLAKAEGEVKLDQMARKGNGNA